MQALVMNLPRLIFSRYLLVRCPSVRSKGVATYMYAFDNLAKGRGRYWVSAASENGF